MGASDHPEVSLVEVTDALPAEFHLLQAEAQSEGFEFLHRLADGWMNGSAKFDKPDECLLAATCDGALAGIGGITEDPVQTQALRMRRFYVRRDFRRFGIAKTLALALLDRALPTGRPILVNAGTPTAPQFWESMGFTPQRTKHHTHVWPT